MSELEAASLKLIRNDLIPILLSIVEKIAEIESRLEAQAELIKRILERTKNPQPNTLGTRSSIIT